MSADTPTPSDASSTIEDLRQLRRTLDGLWGRRTCGNAILALVERDATIASLRADLAEAREEAEQLMGTVQQDRGLSTDPPEWSMTPWELREYQAAAGVSPVLKESEQ